MNIPKPISKLIDHFQRLPGIGPKTAQRLTFQLLHYPQEELKGFAEALTGLKENTKLCETCKNVSENDICVVCGDPLRNERVIAVVSNPMDSLALEKTGFKGVYHVLHGIIDPLNNIGPEEIFIKELVSRVEKLSSDVSFYDISGNQSVEIIMATNTSMEGESTAMYISKILRDAGYGPDKVKITRIARGIPVGGDLEYADDITLSRALEGRHDF
jgi:recombination protein RecR